MRLADVRYDAGERLVVAHVSGEIDMSNSNDIAAAIARSTPNAALGVIVDLKDEVILREVLDEGAFFVADNYGDVDEARVHGDGGSG